MSKRFLRRYLPGPGKLGRNRQLRFALGALLHDPNLWHLNRRSISGAISAGLFVAWVPLPIQMLLAGSVALYFRINLPLSIAVCWVTNPVTIGPMYWSAWWLGSALLGSTHRPRQFELTFQWLTSELAQIWQPLFLGCFILGLLSSAAGYVICRLVWRYQVIWRIVGKRRRRDGGRDRTSM
jgi:uncharacterized protein (DUF2062 family)